MSRTRRRAGIVLALTTALAVLGGGAAEAATVSRIVDGDTIEVLGGARVRLLQIDTPELGGGECYSRAARRSLARLIPVGSDVRLDRDPALDERDRYGRLLRYVTWSGINVNLRMVANGSAAPYFYRGERGRWSDALLAAAQRARRARIGLWASCPRTRLDPGHAIDTGPGSVPRPVAPPPPGASGGGCDPNYTGYCVPIVSYDLDCSDIRHAVTVVGTDIHNFDGDGNGRGCESYG